MNIIVGSTISHVMSTNAGIDCPLGFNCTGGLLYLMGAFATILCLHGNVLGHQVC